MIPSGFDMYLSNKYQNTNSGIYFFVYITIHVCVELI